MIILKKSTIAVLLQIFALTIFLSCFGGDSSKNNNTINNNTDDDQGDTITEYYSVTYDLNGATGGTIPVDSTDYEQGDTVTVSGNPGSLVKAGCVFNGWNTYDDGKGDNYNPSDTFVMGTSDVTLYANWKTALVVYIKPDGDHHNYAVYKKNQDGTGLEQLVSPATGTFDYPTLSHDQNYVLFSESSGNKIYMIGINNNGAALPDPLINTESDVVYYPSFSKDDTKIAFAIDSETEGVSGIYIALVATGSYQKIPNVPANSYYPSWSPDGSQIVYENNSKLYTISTTDATDTPLLLLDDEDYGYMPVWSPVNGQIAYGTDDGIKIYNAYDDEETIALTAGLGDMCDYWSPDGSMLIFDHYEDECDIFSIRISDKQETNITETEDDSEFVHGG